VGIYIGDGSLPVVYEPPVLRLLRDAGLQVKLSWEPNGRRFFRLNEAQMEMELSEHFMAVPDIMSTQKVLAFRSQNSNGLAALGRILARTRTRQDCEIERLR